VLVRPLEDRDRDWLRGLIEGLWGYPVVTPVRSYDAPHTLDGFVAEHDGMRVGAVTWAADGDDVEVVTLNATTPGRGVGRALMEAVRDRAREAAARRVWLITTSENEPALAFYERIGMRRGRAWPRYDNVVRAAKPGLPAGLVFDAVEFEWPLAASG
jgi:GNAT superfamily N-acetyltransferase